MGTIAKGVNGGGRYVWNIGGMLNLRLLPSSCGLATKSTGRGSPEKPPTALAAYIQDNQKTVLAKNPNLKSEAEIKKFITSIWRTDLDAKKKYTDAYKAKMQDYNASLPKKAGRKNKNKGVVAKTTTVRKSTKPLFVLQEAALLLPKAPVPPYALYVRDNYSIAASKYPGVKGNALMKHVAAMWKADAAAKTKYKEMYEAEKKAYEESLTENDRRLIEQIKTAKKTEKAVKEAALLLPKAPVPPYGLYVRDNYSITASKYPGVKGIELMKHVAANCSAMWKADAAAKTKYKEMYEAEKKAYEESLTDEDRSLIRKMKKVKKGTKALEEKTDIIEQYGEEALKELPVEPKLNAYSLFVKEQKGVLPGGKSFLQDAANKWKNLPAWQKRKYQVQVQRNNDTYNKQMESWEAKYENKSLK